VDLSATVGDAISLFANDSLMCAKGASGETACWGSRLVADIQSPDEHWESVGSSTPWLEPDYTTGPHVVEQVLGQMHECHRYADGSVACSGRDQEGQLGNGEPREDSDAPVLVPLPEPAVDLEAALDATCAILESGALACWGANSHILLGTVPSPSGYERVASDGSTSPRLITGIAGPVRALSLSGNAACLIVESGEVQCAGYNGHGTVGLPSWEIGDVVGLMQVTNLPGPAVAITTSVGHACAAFEQGGVTCWGGDRSSEALGAGSWDPGSRRMHVLGFSSPVVALRSADRSTCALTTTGRVVCWGTIEFERTTSGEYGSPMSPAAVPGLLDHEALALQMTSSAACLRTRDDGVRCWGDASLGQLGDGRAFEPRRISGIWPGSPSFYAVDLDSP
jgi:alpha-tubulin suppressor-like RCC1 family protein